jgi:membrane fusion protein (multidrug efflux system)
MPTDETRPTPHAPPEPRPAAPPAPGGQDGPVVATLAPSPPAAPQHPPRLRRWLILSAGGALILAVVLYFGIPLIILTLNTISTDDAYVNSYPTFVAPRVAGQVMKVFVVDDQRVKKGDLIVQLDKEPYQIQVDIKKAAVDVAQTNLTAAQAQVRSQVAQARTNRFKLEHAIEDVNNKVANLRAGVASYKSKVATLALAEANYKRGQELAPTGGISKEDLDIRRQTVEIDKAAVEQALQSIQALRVDLGLPAEPPKGHDLAEVPPNLDQNYSSVREALGELIKSAAAFGYFPTSWNATPRQAIADFYKQDPKGNLDEIYAHLIPKAPAIKQAEAQVEQAQRDLAHAELNLRYCDIPSVIDGVVTRRSVNPGDYVQVGQNLMAVRPVREIWIDANFKETQLANLRIGQLVVVEVDMYGSRQEFKGRIVGFSMGTGASLSLLPPENATGNFVKIVQRLPVRVELTDYDPDKTKTPLFVGLSCTPYVYYKEPPIGPHAGEFLQPVAPLPAIGLNP